MQVDRSYFSLFKFIAAIACGMGLLAMAVVIGINYAVDRAVSMDARVKAADWANYFIHTLPDLDRLLVDGKLDERQKNVVATAAKVGNVFRFKLYDASGATVLESDAELFEKEADSDHIDNEALDVVKLKKEMVSLNDGTNERNMPALYAEAYLPVLKANGDLRAIVETYVDQTKTASFFKMAFRTLALVLGLGTALAFGTPTLAYMLRTKQARMVKHRVEFLARHDPLTSLLNRASFAELLSERIAERPSGQCLAVVFIDVDDFKLINDSFGHEAGDEFLKHVAHSITSICGPDDFVARVGGDEFLIAMTRDSEMEVIAAVEAVMTGARQQITIRGRRVSGRVSAGIHILGDTVGNVEDAVHHADIAMYQSKVDGKNTVRLFSQEMEVRMRKRRELELLVREALREGLFELHYQPLLDGGSQDCVGFEALLRLRGHDGAYVSPATFIPVAESLGLIADIGKWVIGEATRTAVVWPDDLFVSVNLSVRQFADDQLLANVEAALADSRLAPGRLELEVTESLLMENTESVTRQLAALKARGVSIAMDDFGTGYSSLGYLWQFGFDKLKIDRSFVSALDVDAEKGREILDTIVTLAHKLGMKVTAEGIETEHQAAILGSLGCDQFQGFLFGKPAPGADVAPFLLRRFGAKVLPATQIVPGQGLARA
jgi:diguanylate cyclase (GGDEF)-like protein